MLPNQRGKFNAVCRAEATDNVVERGGEKFASVEGEQQAVMRQLLLTLPTVCRRQETNAVITQPAVLQRLGRKAGHWAASSGLGQKARQVNSTVRLHDAANLAKVHFANASAPIVDLPNQAFLLHRHDHDR